MDNIIIGSIEMPRTKSLEIGGSYESKEITMASAKSCGTYLAGEPN